ncbi:MAG: S8 family serine peptidase [Desulfobacteraceae bacterium]|nr:S8 family serine peptidase [Desulfobacteraceae bacterium]
MRLTIFCRLIIGLCGLLLLWGCTSGKGDPVAPPPTPTPGYAITGTIYSAANNRVDGDINDDTSSVVTQANNSYSAAQQLPNPVVVGGYVNVARQGKTGQSYLNGDPEDYYAVSLHTGDTVRLVLPDSTDTDPATVQLRLYNNAQAEQGAQTLNNGDNEYLSVSTDGNYYIRITASSGGTNYRLIVGAAFQSSNFTSNAEFVPGDVLVKFKTTDRQVSAVKRTALAQNFSMRAVSIGSGHWARLHTADMAATFAGLNIGAAPKSNSALSGAALTKAQRQDTLRLVQALQAHPDVAYAQPNYIRRAFLIPNDPLFDLQWHYRLIHLPAAWEVTTGSASVIVAVIDTGILASHPDLVGKQVQGYDFISASDGAGDGNGIDNDPTDPNGDSSYHGTHVAGIIGAAFNNNRGVAGVGGQTMIMPVRVLGANGGTDADIANGIRWAAGLDILDNNGAVLVAGASPHADIINMSLGGTETSKVLEDAITAASDAHVILIAAAGNDGSDTPEYPAAYPQVISVSAVDAAAQPAFYTSFGDTISVAAPGGDMYADLQPDGYADGILSTLGDETTGAAIYGYLQGTSMAAPHVAGVAALMKAAWPAMAANDFQASVVNGQITAHLGTTPRDRYYGYGLIDAYQAVAAAVAAAGGSPPAAIISVTPGAVWIDGFTNSAQLAVRQIGSGSVTLNSVQSSQNWLSVAPPVSGPLDLGQYTLTVDRSALSGGTHEAVVTFNYATSNTILVPVRVEVLPDIAASASVQYLLLVRASNGSVAARQTITPVNGVYAFSFSNIRSGEYYLISGSNLDNDSYVTDQGEAAGVYPPGAVNPFNLQSDLSGITFVTGFSQNPFPYSAAALLSSEEVKQGSNDE